MANILIVHQNFPGQFPHIAHALQRRGHRVVAIGGPTARALPGIEFRRWGTKRGSTKGVFAAAVRAEADLIRAEAATLVAQQLKQDGFEPDVIIAHPSWGETLHFNLLFPAARQILFGELFYRASGLDVGFDPEFATHGLAQQMRVNAKNATQALAYTAADTIVCPTRFQASTFPRDFQAKIRVLHEGIDTDQAKRRPGATVALRDGRILDGSRPVITFVSRTLEPMRGFHSFMRALPQVLEHCPDAEILLIGKEEGSGYGALPENGKSWKAMMLAELAGRLDLARVHFMGSVPYATMIDALSISWAHVYLTYPFVLSWSLLEAMACECLVIASDTPPLHDAIRDGENGLLVDFFDHRALAAKLIEAVSSPETFTPIRTRARQTVIDRFDLHTIGLPGWINLVEQVPD